MDMKRVLASSIVLAAVFAAPAFAGGDGIGGGSNNCSRVGTWFGVGDSGITWMATDNPGANATVGQLALEWTVIDPTLGGYFPDVVRATNAVGVWQKVNRNTYEYTWIAYGLDAVGLPFYVARASGTASMADCDHVNITYALELFDPAQDMSTEPPLYGCFSGTATETRVPLVQATCE